MKSNQQIFSAGVCVFLGCINILWMPGSLINDFSFVCCMGMALYCLKT